MNNKYNIALESYKYYKKLLESNEIILNINEYSLLYKLSSLLEKINKKELEISTNICNSDLINCSKNIGFTRSEMPQIDNLSDLTRFLKLMSKSPLNFKYIETNIDVTDIKLNPVQKELSSMNIYNICELYKNNKWNPKENPVPVILVKDTNNNYHVIDGHHRAFSKTVCLNSNTELLKVIILYNNSNKNSKELSFDIITMLNNKMPELFKGYKHI